MTGNRGSGMMRALLPGALAALLLAGPARAAFEDIGAGARPIGMGSVFTAIADDANTVHYNPAGLGQLRHPQMTAGYGRLYLGLTDGSNLGSGLLGVTLPIKDGRWGTVGVGALNLQLVGAYSENTWSVAYGKEVAPALFAGAAVKSLQRGYGTDAYTANDPLFRQHGKSAQAASMDLGLLYRWDKHYVLAASVKDVNNPDVGLGTADKVPPAWKAGFAYYQRAFVVSAEATRRDRDSGMALGGERWFMKHLVAGRMGFDFGSRNRRNLGLGASVRMGNAQIDYSFLLPLTGITDTNGSHRVSLTVRFGKVEAGPIALLEQEEILGEGGASSAEVEALRRDLDRFQQEALSYQRDTDRIQARIVELEAQIRGVRGGAAPKAAPAPKAVPAEGAEIKTKIDQLEQELQRQRGELEQRQKAGPAAPAALQTPFKRPGVYTVLEGDTLQSIAEKTTGDATRWAQIYTANKDRIKRGGVVTPGQVLIIP